MNFWRIFCICILCFVSVQKQARSEGPHSPYDEMPIFGVTQDEEFGCEYDGAPTGLEIRRCIGKQTDKLNEELEQLTNLIANSMNIRVDEMRISTGRDEFGDGGIGLLKVHEKWLVYRHANCDFYYSQPGGSIGSRFYAACMMRMTKSRMKEMHHLAILEGIEEGS